MSFLCLSLNDFAFPNNALEVGRVRVFRSIGDGEEREVIKRD